MKIVNRFLEWVSSLFPTYETKTTEFRGNLTPAQWEQFHKVFDEMDKFFEMTGEEGLER